MSIKPCKLAFSLTGFSGPLGLLLQLLDSAKLSITEIDLSEVTEQYLRYMDNLEEKQPEELADFLVIAARLLLMKSRKLLPQFGTEEEECPSLEAQLKLYKQFVEASKELNALWIGEKQSFSRIEPSHKIDTFVIPKNMSLKSLQQSIKMLLVRLAPLKPLPQTQIDDAVSMKEKIDTIRRVLKQKKTVQFTELLFDVHNKTEVIMGFIALLELLKQRVILLEQNRAFDDIFVHSIS